MRCKTIMIQGVASNVGKSIITTGLCRIFSQDGYRVAPFKSQNMSSNVYINESGDEISIAQVVQCEAAGIAPDVRVNPVLLKPLGDSLSDVYLNGKKFSRMTSKEYFNIKKSFIPNIMDSFNSIASENDIIVIEGAGSPAEINLKTDDIVNMGLARLCHSPVLLVGDIDRGGVFASLTGTLSLLDEIEQSIVKGVIINKFRGDIELLKPGINMLEEIIKKPVLGVVPYVNVAIEAEDSLSSKLSISTHIMRSSKNIDAITIDLSSNFVNTGIINILSLKDNINFREVSNKDNFGNPELLLLYLNSDISVSIDRLKRLNLLNSIDRCLIAGKPMLLIFNNYFICSLGKNTLLDISDYEGYTQFNLSNNINNDGIENILSLLKSYNKKSILSSLKDLSKIVIYDNNSGLQAVIKTLISGVFNDLSGCDVINEDPYDSLASTLRSSLDMDSIYRIINDGIS